MAFPKSCFSVSLVAILFLGVGFVPSAVRAELFLYDGFDYEPGIDGLTGADGGIGWEGPWEPWEFSRTTPDVIAGSLDYTDSVGNQLQTSGNHLFFSSLDMSALSRRLIDMSSVPASLVEEGRLGKDGTSVWLSFLLQTETEPDPVWGGVSLYDEDFEEFAKGANTANRVDVGFKNDDGGSANFGMGFPGRPDPGFISSDVPLDQLSFLAVRFDFNELVNPDTNEGEDEIYMWVNPRLDQVPDDNDALFLPFRRRPEADDTDATYMFDRIQIEIGAVNQGVMDEVRFGETFADVSPTIGITGDFDRSGVLDLPDVNMLSQEIATDGNGQSFDLNGDSVVDLSDLRIWVEDLKKTWFGDVNLDGEFVTGDLVAVLAGGKFGQDADASWEEGDWSGDLRFTSGDLIVALADGGFEQGPRPVAAAVPEPASFVLFGLGIFVFALCRPLLGQE